ncbi:MAG: class C beta-lactamase-related serine hydrolase [Chitinophagaceae bacterium]|nr:MAG: class C beta-lactamase-related serine hydrolase [Chitinophagaceae bacterium]
MLKHFPIVILALFISCSTPAQVPDLIPIDPVTNPVHVRNTGRITFMDRNIPLDTYREKDFLDSFSLSRRNTLNIRVFMANSITNFMHQLAPSLPLTELSAMGNFQFAFYIDDSLVYRENINAGCSYGSGGNKNTSTSFRVPFTSTTGEDWWAMYLWDRFRLNGGDKVLTDGLHILKVELRPYVSSPAGFTDKPVGDYVDQGMSTAVLRVGHIIATGTVQLKVSTPLVSAAEMAIQPVRPGSGWKVSKAGFDRSKIESMNAAIERYELKDISSVVVVSDGRLLIEEYFNGANRNTLHDTRSAGKSFTSTLMGMAIRDGYIRSEDEELKSFYNLQQYQHYSGVKDSIRIKDLLTMSSALNGSDAHSESPGNEENMYPTSDWVKFTLDLAIDSNKTNGRQWDYFTAGVVLMGDMLDKRIPGGLERYAAEKLFRPLGITHYKWQYTPRHVVNTAGSLAMTSLEYARYAQLYKNNGMWGGKQVVPSAWIKKTFTRQLSIPGRVNEFYGYLFWNKTYVVNGKNYEAFYCAGNGGNEFIIFNDLPVVIIITSKAFNKPYGHLQAERIVKEFVLPAILHP